MAHLKRKDWLKAEDDATTALAIDASHVKSYQRRSAARASLGKLRAALLDLSRAEAELGLGLGGASGGSGTACAGSIGAMQKSIRVERRRIESLLRAAMKRAPKRCNVPIAVVHPEKEEEEEKIVEEQDDDAVSKASGVDNDIGSASDVSREPNDFAVVDSGGGDNENGSAPTKPRQHQKPTTWYEFEATWRSLDSLEERGAYLLSSVKPKWLGVLYRNGIEDAQIVVDIVTAAGTLVDVHKKSRASLAKEYIQAVTNTKSIGIPVMMMDDGQRKQVRDAIDKVFGVGGVGEDSKGAVAAKLGC